MACELIDIHTRQRVMTYAAEVKCIGGQNSLFFEISMPGMKPEHIHEMLSREFKYFSVIDQNLLGMTAKLTDDQKLRVCMIFPLGYQINDARNVASLCDSLSTYISGHATRGIKK